MTENSRCPPKLYLLGDSNTQKAFEESGFASKLANKYIRIADVVNRGFNGFTSEHLRFMLPKLLQNDNTPVGSIHTATILLGSNDCVLGELDNRHVPLQRYQENLEFIVKRFQEIGVCNIILMSPPPVDETAWNTFLMNVKGVNGAHQNSVVKLYADICKELASNLHLHFIDLYTEMMGIDDWKSYFTDGIHLSSKGNEFVFSKLSKVLHPLLGSLPTVYPDWSVIDNSCLEKHLA